MPPLYKIYHANNASKFPNSVQYNLNRLNSVILFDLREKLYNPFQEKEDKIKQHLNSQYEDIVALINSFKNDINKLANMITNFQNSFGHIVANELEGS